MFLARFLTDSIKRLPYSKRPLFNVFLSISVPLLLSTPYIIKRSYFVSAPIPKSAVSITASKHWQGVLSSAVVHLPS